MRKWVWLAVGLAMAAGVAKAADKKTLEELIAPPPAAVRSLPPGQNVRDITLARVVVQLKPEPWALLNSLVNAGGGKLERREYRLISWQSGQEDVRTSTFSGIFADEFRAAGGGTSRAADSLFSEGSSSGLQLGVRLTEMQGKFCEYCGLTMRGRWAGAVTMTAHWEIYSVLERKVVAAIETSGGYTTPKERLDGEPDRLINEAFRDNARRLIATDQFRQVVTSSPGDDGAIKSATDTIALRVASTNHTVSDSPKSVAVVFAADGSGSGFLISSDGYVLTNQHVVGATKYVKLKWSDGAESLGEVVRVDNRRDVALIKTDAHGRSPLDLRAGPVQQGEPVYAIGSPLGEAQQNTMTKGIVSATRVRDGLLFIQSDVAVTHGNSGGPLLDGKGAVIGITDWGLAPNGSPIGLNFFIPIDDALRALSLTAAPAAAPLHAAAAPPARAARKR